jgi:hypothetical protein
MSKKKTYDDLEKFAKRLIEKEDDFAFYIAYNRGQMFDNVKHMSWYIETVMHEITLEYPKYAHLTIKEF